MEFFSSQYFINYTISTFLIGHLISGLSISSIPNSRTSPIDRWHASLPDWSIYTIPDRSGSWVPDRLPSSRCSSRCSGLYQYWLASYRRPIGPFVMCITVVRQSTPLSTFCVIFLVTARPLLGDLAGIHVGYHCASLSGFSGNIYYYPWLDFNFKLRFAGLSS